jgi:hypothetical protein
MLHASILGKLRIMRCMPGFACKGPKGRDGGLEEVRSSTRETRVRRCYSEPGGRPGRVPVHKSLAPPRRKKTTTLILRPLLPAPPRPPGAASETERVNLRPCSLPLTTQNISSSTHHIKSFDACMEH